MCKINKKEWGKNGRNHKLFKDLDFVLSLIGKKVRLIDVREGHEWRGIADSLFWDEKEKRHVINIKSVDGILTEEIGEINVWEICYYESIDYMK